MKRICLLARCGRWLGLLSGFIVVALFTTTNLLQAQWVETNGPFHGPVYALGISGSSIFAGTDAGVSRTINNGANWTVVNAGLTDTNVTSLAVSGTNILVGTYGGGVFRSTNNGTIWAAVNAGLTNTTVFALVVSGANVFAGTSGGEVFLSTNNGTSWTAVSSTSTNTSVYSFAVAGSNLFAGTFGGGVFRSTNNGTSWTPANNGLTNPAVYALAVSGANPFAGTGGGAFRSTNSGTTWTAVNNGLSAADVNALAVAGTNLFAGTYAGVFRSANNGTSWTEINTGLISTVVYSFVVSATDLFAGTSDGSVWRRPLSEILVSVEGLPAGLPVQFGLDQNYPNPFNPATTISFSLPSKSFVSLKVFNALGGQVSILLSEELPAGTYAKHWDAASLPSGVYFYRLQAGVFSETRRLVLLR